MKKWQAYFMLGIILLLVLAFFATLSHASTSVPYKNTYGAVISQDNPNRYLEGIITNGDIVKDGKKTYTVIRFQPTHTFTLFTEDFAFCGDQAKLFTGMTGVVVVTFSKVQHQRWCHELYSIHKVEAQ